MNVKVIFGSTTGNTENVANQIAAAFGVDAVNVASATADDFNADLLVLGTSTWGAGDLQDDWAASGMALLEGADLAGKKVAVFGEGDQIGFGDTYCDAMGILAKKAAERGAEIVGKTSTEGYQHTASQAVDGDQFLGLALDENNQAELTEGRLAAWIESIK